MSKGSTNYKSRVVPLSGLVVTWGLGQGADWKTPASRARQGRMVLPPLHRPCSVLPPCSCPTYMRQRCRESPASLQDTQQIGVKALALGFFLQCPPSSPLTLWPERVTVLAPVRSKRTAPIFSCRHSCLPELWIWSSYLMGICIL